MPTNPSFTPFEFRDGDGSRPVTASRLNAAQQQYAAAMKDVATDAADPSSPIGQALSTTKP